MEKVKIVCRALIINKKSRLLIVKKTGSDFWSLPGGSLEVSDLTVQQCLLRELKEELGLGVTVQNIRFVHELYKDNTRFVELIWQATLTPGSTEIPENIYEVSGGELSEIQWVKKEDLRNISIKPEFLREMI